MVMLSVVRHSLANGLPEAKHRYLHCGLSPQGIAVWSGVTPLHIRGSFTPATPPPSPPLRPHFAQAPPPTPHADALSTTAAAPCAECPCRCHAPRARASARPEMPGQ